MKKLFVLVVSLLFSLNSYSWVIIQDLGQVNLSQGGTANKYVICGLDGLAYVGVVDSAGQTYGKLKRLGKDYDPYCAEYNTIKENNNPYYTDDVRSTIYQQFLDLHGM